MHYYKWLSHYKSIILLSTILLQFPIPNVFRSSHLPKQTLQLQCWKRQLISRISFVPDQRRACPQLQSNFFDLFPVVKRIIVHQKRHWRVYCRHLNQRKTPSHHQSVHLIGRLSHTVSQRQRHHPRCRILRTRWECRYAIRIRRRSRRRGTFWGRIRRRSQGPCC